MYNIEKNLLKRTQQIYLKINNINSGVATRVIKDKQKQLNNLNKHSAKTEANIMELESLNVLDINRFETFEFIISSFIIDLGIIESIYIQPFIISIVNLNSKYNEDRLNLLKLNKELKLIEKYNFDYNIMASYNGCIIWEVKNFFAKIKDGCSDKELFLESLPFKTSFYGYKFKAILYPNGNGCGWGSHLSMYIQTLESEYDDILEWPVKYKVRFTLINLNNFEYNVTSEFSTNRLSVSCQQPINGKLNPPIGLPRFSALSLLSDGKYNYVSQAGSIFIKVMVECSNPNLHEN